MDKPKRSSRWLWLMLVGALLGGGIATWAAPHIIVWYFDPPAQFGFNCRAPIEWSLRRFQLWQLVGVVIGCLLGLALALSLSHRRRGLPETTT